MKAADRKHDEPTYGCVALKRDGCPEWLFAMFVWVIPYQPFTWLFTRPVRAGDF